MGGRLQQRSTSSICLFEKLPLRPSSRRQGNRPQITRRFTCVCHRKLQAYRLPSFSLRAALPDRQGPMPPRTVLKSSDITYKPNDFFVRAGAASGGCPGRSKLWFACWTPLSDTQRQLSLAVQRQRARAAPSPSNKQEQRTPSRLAISPRARPRRQPTRAFTAGLRGIYVTDGGVMLGKKGEELCHNRHVRSRLQRWKCFFRLKILKKMMIGTIDRCIISESKVARCSPPF